MIWGEGVRNACGVFGCRWCVTDVECKDIVHTLFNRHVRVRDGRSALNVTGSGQGLIEGLVNIWQRIFG